MSRRMLYDRNVINFLPYAAKCSECKIKWTTSRCGGCDKAFYCNRNCQVKNWSSHQNVCEERRNLVNDNEMERERNRRNKLRLFLRMFCKEVN